jgi:hypothetical protein
VNWANERAFVQNDQVLRMDRHNRRKILNTVPSPGNTIERPIGVTRKRGCLFFVIAAVQSVIKSAQSGVPLAL